jgi:PTH1 family peptidyl-tRNA hydrolase
MVIKLVIGLGNPGKSYATMRHNLGYRVVDRLSENPLLKAGLYKPSDVFMNSSGIPVAALARKKGLKPEEILVVCDDFSIPLGSLRIRLQGSSGGHNGLDSILSSLSTQGIPRLRMGIGPVPEGRDPADFVLESFRSEEKHKAEEMIDLAAKAVETALEEGIETAMNRYNKREVAG